MKLGEIKTEDLEQKYQKWKKLVNLSSAELIKFIDSDLGKEAGISRETAKEEKISRGRDSARAILRMRDKSFKDWNDLDIKWMNKQISFISRMSNASGDLIKDGKPTRKLTSLWIWGNMPNNLKPSSYMNKV